MVLGGQEELDYYLYWATVYHSSLPYFKQLAKFIRDVIRITVWEVGSLAVISSSGTGHNSLVQHDSNSLCVLSRKPDCSQQLHDISYSSTWVTVCSMPGSCGFVVLPSIVWGAAAVQHLSLHSAPVVGQAFTWYIAHPYVLLIQMSCNRCCSLLNQPPVFCFSQLGDSGQPETSVLIRLSVAGSCTVQDTLYTVNPVVAPKLQRPPLDPSLQLNSAEKSPLVTAVDDVTSLRVGYSPRIP